MPDFDALPDTFEDRRIADEKLACAYEAVSPQARARLKTTQALIQAVYAEPPLPREIRTRSAAAGYAVRLAETAAAWVVAVAGKAVPPARLTAALTMARLSGVGRAAVVFPAPDMPPAAFTALDLCGVEDAFALSLSETEALLRHLCQGGNARRGRLLLFSAPAGLILLARELSLPCWDAKTAAPPARMHGEELKGCWLDTDLRPSFFINTAIHLHSLNPEARHA